MSDLTARIRAKLAPTYTAPWAMKQYRVALGAVLDLHAAETEHSWDYGWPRRGWPRPGGEPSERKPLCSQCSAGYEHQVPWPCRTVRDLAKELGIEVGNV